MILATLVILDAVLVVFKKLQNSIPLPKKTRSQCWVWMRNLHRRIRIRIWIRIQIWWCIFNCFQKYVLNQFFEKLSWFRHHVKVFTLHSVNGINRRIHFLRWIWTGSGPNPTGSLMLPGVSPKSRKFYLIPSFFFSKGSHYFKTGWPDFSRRPEIFRVNMAIVFPILLTVILASLDISQIFPGPHRT